MIPQGCIIVGSIIPSTTSGKIGRGKLRQAASPMREEHPLQVNHIQRRAPEPLEEAKLHRIVTRILSRNKTTFDINNNFIQLGGDSISAMRLA